MGRQRPDDEKTIWYIPKAYLNSLVSNVLTSVNPQLFHDIPTLSTKEDTIQVTVKWLKNVLANHLS